MIVALISCQSGNHWEIRSPDGNMKVLVSQDSTGALQYQVSLNGEKVILPSKLGISLSGKGYSFMRDLDFAKQSDQVVRNEYTAISGKRKHHTYHASEKEISFRNPSGNILKIIFRVSNHEVAFRYELDNQKSMRVDRETSEFTLPGNSIAWIQRYRGAWNDYEMFYTRRLVDTMQQPAYYIPGLFRTPEDQWIFISDAGVMGGYAACQLKHQGNGKLAVRFPDQQTAIPEGLEDSWFSVVHAESPDIVVPPCMLTPWRAMIISDDLGDIVESNITEHLSKPPEIDDLDWIEPGVAVFPWWGNSNANDDPEILKDYIDLAAEMNWDYLEFDIGLIGNNGGYAANFWREVAYIPEVIEYADSRGIKVYGWDERRFLDTPEERDDVFSQYRQWGVAGIKMDYINSDKQEAMKWYVEATSHAAEYQLLVSFHGAITPRGLRRTFPNIMTYEGVRGAEYYKFGGADEIPDPRHNATLPFTRNVSGPMDYTPTTFSAVRRTSTCAHELALPFVFESGWVCMADRPEEFRNCPARELLQNLHAAWDDIHFIDGYPGEFCCLARKKGDQWFVAAINAGAGRTIKIPFDFLSEKKYGAILYTDDGKGSISKKRMELTNRSNETLKLVENGGCIIHIVPGEE